MKNKFLELVLALFIFLLPIGVVASIGGYNFNPLKFAVQFQENYVENSENGLFGYIQVYPRSGNESEYPLHMSFEEFLEYFKDKRFQGSIISYDNDFEKASVWFWAYATRYKAYEAMELNRILNYYEQVANGEITPFHPIGYFDNTRYMIYKIQEENIDLLKSIETVVVVPFCFIYDFMYSALNGIITLFMTIGSYHS